MKKNILFLITSLIIGVLSIQAKAAVVGYIGDKPGFDAAVAGLSGVSINVLDFESQTAGSVVSDGSTLQGLTFSSNLPSPLEMGVRGIGGTSGLNTLAVTPDGGNSLILFGLGDVVDVSFASSHAFGFYLVFSEDFRLLADDVILTFAGTTIALNGTETADDFGTDAFDALWIGLVDDTATHTSAKIQFGQQSSNFVSIGEFDDFTTTRAIMDPTPVSEPTAILLFCIGLLGLFRFTRRCL